MTSVEYNRLARAQRGEDGAFEELIAPYRRELHLHCYRILGSFQDAEDLLQETLLAAWRGLERFEGRSSLRAWLYTIATNRCLNALRDGRRRPQAVAAGAGLGAAENFSEIAWLEPYPDRLLESAVDLEPGPEARYEAKETVALAFVSGLQHLPPRQRAVLVLRDVLGFHADEVADMLGTSVPSVTSALQRARASLETRGAVAARQESVSLPASESERELVSRFADAFLSDDVDAVLALLTDDAVISMPPEPLWRQGRDDIGAFLRERAANRSEDWRFVATRANGQPALAYYLRAGDGAGYERAGLFVIGLTGEGIASITRFPERPWMAEFDLPARVD
jgi:RNA polymerase sigma-70 factor (ECF subfamily)